MQVQTADIKSAASEADDYNNLPLDVDTAEEALDEAAKPGESGEQEKSAPDPDPRPQKPEQHEQVQPDEEEQKPEESSEEEPQPSQQQRIRASWSQRELDAIALKKEAKEQGVDLTLDECLRKVDTETGVAAEDVQPPAPVESRPRLSQRLEEDLKSLDEQLREAEDEDEDSAQTQSLRDQRQVLLGQIGAAKFSEQREQSSQVDAARFDSREKALKRHPALSDSNSPMSREVSALIREYQDENSPHNGLLFVPEAPEIIAQRAENRLVERTARSRGVSEDQARAILFPSNSSPQVSNSTQQKVKPAGGPSSQPGASQMLTRDDLLGSATFNPDVAEEILQKSGHSNRFFHL